MNCKNCGGAVSLTEADVQDYENWREGYECADCGRHGSLRLTGGEERRSGCLAN